MPSIPGRRRCSVGLLAGLLAVVLLTGSLAAAPYAYALGEGGQALHELTESQPEGTQTTTTGTSTTSNSSTSNTSNSHTTILLAALAAVVLLCVIGFVIARDARRVAPATDAELAEARSAHDPAIALRKRRAKAKAARKQRKRNR